MSEHAMTPLEIRQLHARGLGSESSGESVRRALEVIRAGAPSCETCRWWDRLPPGDGDSGLCGMAQTRPGHRKIVAVHPGHCILTAPDFGCIQWEGRDDG